MATNARIVQLKEILEMDPKNILTRYALGMEYSGAGQTDEAVKTFQELLTVNADYANAYFMAAQALQAAGRSDEARKWLHDGIAAAKRSNNRHAENEMQAMLDEISY
jgi:tetratricopeptide (TPR) repeat protein